MRQLGLVGLLFCIPLLISIFFPSIMNKLFALGMKWIGRGEITFHFAWYHFALMLVNDLALWGISGFGALPAGGQLFTADPDAASSCDWHDGLLLGAWDARFPDAGWFGSCGKGRWGYCFRGSYLCHCQLWWRFWRGSGGHWRTLAQLVWLFWRLACGGRRTEQFLMKLF